MFLLFLSNTCPASNPSMLHSFHPFLSFLSFGFPYSSSIKRSALSCSHRHLLIPLYDPDLAFDRRLAERTFRHKRRSSFEGKGHKEAVVSSIKQGTDSRKASEGGGMRRARRRKGMVRDGWGFVQIVMYEAGGKEREGDTK